MNHLTHSVYVTIKKKKTFVQMLVVFSLLLLVLLTLTTFLLTALFSGLVVTEISENSKSLLNRTAESTSFVMQWTLSYSLKSKQDPDVTAYAIQNYNDPMNDKTIWTKLRAIKENHMFIDSIYVINGLIDTVVDTEYGVSTLDDFYDPDLIRILAHSNSSKKLQLIPRHLDAIINSNPVSKNLISIIIPYDSESSNSAFIVNLDTLKIKNFLGVVPNTTLTQLMLVNEDNVIITGSQESSFLQGISTNMIASESMNKQQVKISVDNLPYILLSAKVPVIADNQWRLIQLIPENDILKKVKHVKTLSIMVYLILLAAAFILIWIISRKIYSPIEKLVQDVMHAEQEDGYAPEGEVNLLSKIFVQQKTKLNKLALFKRDFEPYAKSKALRQLLAEGSNLSYPRIAALFKEHGIEISLEGLLLIVVRIDQFHLFSNRYNFEDQRLFRYGMTNILKEHLNGSYPTEAIDMESDHIVVLINMEEDNAHKVLTELSQCQSLIKQFLKLSTTIACSDWMESYLELNPVYKMTYELTHDRFIHGSAQIFVTDSHKEITQPTVAYAYPDAKAKKILDELKLVHLDACLKHLESFSEQLKLYPQSENRLYYTHLIFELGKTLQNLKLADGEESNWNLNFAQNQIENLETSDQVHQWIQLQILAVFSRMESNLKSAKSVSILGEVEKIIHEHLFDPNLSTKLIADKIGFSIKYLRVLFKEEAQLSISDYITDKRLDHVIRLLMETDKSVEDIAYETGFAALNSFYLVFKKKFGMPPNQYRKKKE